MDAIYPVKVLLFWDSEIARHKGWTFPTNQMISHAELHHMFYFNLFSMNNDNEMRYLWTIAPDLAKKWIHILVEFIQIQQQMISSTQAINTTNMTEHITAIWTLFHWSSAESMNNDNEMRYLWTIAPDLAKEWIHILVEFIQIQQQTISSTQAINTTNMTEHVTAITQMVSHEPSMLYTTVTNDDTEIDHSVEDYISSSQSELDNNNDAEEEELQTPIIPIIENAGTQRESSQVVKSKSDHWTAKCYHHSDSNYCSWYICIIKKAKHDCWEITTFIKKHTSYTYSTKQTLKHIIKIYFNVNIAPSCQRSRDTCVKRHRGSAVCRENGRANTYVPEIYSQQTYGRTYQANFNPILSENFWRYVPFNLTFYPPNMNKERGRKQGTRFQGEMNYRNLDSPPRCGRCRMSGHNRKNCNNPGSSNV
ncbi:hypothetical protein M9H77_06654 [Catharanthus roseus]|uniref:Uncharacterized protein n=1 Tax=Catharanthus roseus TaxID=4058 RepID=A0ACC0BSY7_CATRO|nr:hypothetical protein M9H77_06654 [Catharanthus roseus]